MKTVESLRESSAANSAKPTPPTVFYDGRCPLCSREIAHYRRLRGADRLQWIDITREQASLLAYGLQFDVAMSRFHVLDSDGRWQTGAWGFAELWSHLPAYRWLARTLRATYLLPILDRIYTRFARRRLRRSCTTQSCTPAAKIAVGKKPIDDHEC